MMADLSIERLSLSAAGLSGGDGRRLAQLIADRLSAAPLPDVLQARDSLRSEIVPRAGGSLQELSEQIVADLLRQLQRSL